MTIYKLFIIAVFSLSSTQAFSQLAYESRLFECIQQEYRQRGVDIAAGMDSVETQFVNLNYLSDSVSVYQLIQDQADALPMQIDYYVKSMDIRTNNYLQIRADCYSKISVDKDSKYYRLVKRLEEVKATSPSEVWNKIGKVLNAEDFEHPLYRLMGLTTLHSWSLKKSRIND